MEAKQKKKKKFSVYSVYIFRCVFDLDHAFLKLETVGLSSVKAWKKTSGLLS